jgi:hypothetical protein
MRALEFQSKIKNNHIVIPARLQSELMTNKNRDIRVIVFVDDSDIYDNLIFQQSAKDAFLNGYADSDSIYDKY